MSRYTTTIDTIMTYDEQRLRAALSTYPLFNEEYRNTLNDKILNHYRFREIGQETVNRFCFYLTTRMAEIMPKYNVLYEYQDKYLKEGLLGNVNLTETYESKNASESKGTSKDDVLYQDTPQGKIFQNALKDQQYATNFTQSESANSGEGSGTMEYVKKVVGNNGTRYSVDLINAIAKRYSDIDVQVINDLDILFMGIY